VTAAIETAIDSDFCSLWGCIYWDTFLSWFD
jgi:hypothetical protein